MPRPARLSLWLVWGGLLWITAMWLAWLLLARGDFLYPLAYRQLDIPATIETYAPQNRHGKADFADTDAVEHIRLFAAMAKSIRQEGVGLDGLVYRAPSGREMGVLLTVDEVNHLRDVAHLVDVGERLGGWAALGCLVLSLLMILARMGLPSMRGLLGASAALLALGGVILLALGPVEVFYAWHRWVFPPDHPWFFYYQDSLMSTLMQAPNLFGFIGVAWLLTGLAMLAGLHAGARWFENAFKRRL